MMSTTSMPTSVDEFRRELSLLTQRVETVEARLAHSGNSPLPPLVLPPEILAKVREITQEIFPGKCEFTSEFDPEYPEDRYVVVNVEATGEVKEIVDRECVWSERIERLSEDLFRTLRLSIIPL